MIPKQVQDRRVELEAKLERSRQMESDVAIAILVDTAEIRGIDLAVEAYAKAEPIPIPGQVRPRGRRNLRERTFEYVVAHPGKDVDEIAAGIGRCKARQIQSALDYLKARGRVMMIGFGWVLQDAAGEAAQ